MTWEPDDSEQTWRKRPSRPGRRDEPAQSSSQLFEAMRRFFEEDEWKFVQVEEQPILRLGCTGENGEWTCYAQMKEEPGRFIFYSVLSAKAPENKRLPLAEFLTRANYGMILGNFELDFGDGEIRYKTSAYVEDFQPSKDFFHTLVYTNLLVMDKYLPGIMSVIYAGMNPEQAIAHVSG
jgi:hypothetical protein